MQCVLKIDVDTFRGMAEGVPILLDILKREEIKASFFLSFGPDCSGQAIWRVFTKPGFFSKMIRTNAPKMYGFKTLLYGTFLPAPLIASSFPSIVHRIRKEGHETGVHAWNHVFWQDRLLKVSTGRIKDELGLAWKSFEKLLGYKPRSFAAPAWLITEKCLGVLEELGIEYSSSTRGINPFLPCCHGRMFKFLEIPTTLPTFDEVLGREGVTLKNWNLYLMERFKPGLNVLTIHAETEGLAFSGIFHEFIHLLKGVSCDFLTFETVYQNLRGTDIPVHDISLSTIPGRAGVVAVQNC